MDCPFCGHRLTNFDPTRGTWWCGAEMREVFPTSDEALRALNERVRRVNAEALTLAVKP